MQYSFEGRYKSQYRHWDWKQIHTLVDANVKDVLLSFIYYHLPTTDVRPFYPQNYHQLHGAHSTIKGLNVQISPKNHNIFIPINRKEANLPIIYNSYMTSAQKKRHGPLLRSGIKCIGFDYWIYLEILEQIQTSVEQREK